MKLRVIYTSKEEFEKFKEIMRDYTCSVKISDKHTQKGKKIAYINLKI